MVKKQKVRDVIKLKGRAYELAIELEETRAELFADLENIDAETTQIVKALIDNAAEVAHLISKDIKQEVGIEDDMSTYELSFVDGPEPHATLRKLSQEELAEKDSMQVLYNFSPVGPPN